MATKRIVRAHSTQRGKEDKLVHALLEGETRGGGEGDVGSAAVVVQQGGGTATRSDD